MTKRKQVKIDGLVFDFYWKNNTWHAYVARSVKTSLPADIKIPATVDGEIVERINANAFKGRAIKSVEYPDTIEYIGSEAFYGCKYLEVVKSYPTKNTAKQLCVDSRAFCFCESLKEFSTHVPVERILSRSFASCFRLKEFNAVVRVFDSCVFEGNSQLSKIILDNGAYWEQDSFVRAKGLKTFVFNGQIANHVSKTKIKALANKKLICTKDFQYLDLVYEGVEITLTKGAT